MVHVATSSALQGICKYLPVKMAANTEAVSGDKHRETK
jgi:hypothetical protein